MKMTNFMNNLIKAFIVFSLFLSFNTIAQKTDVRVEIYDLKEEVKKLKIDNQKLSTDLSTTTIKYENRILDLGAKIEDLRFEFNVLKRILEQYRNVENTSNSTSKTNINSNSSPSQNSSSTEENSTEKPVSKPKNQSSSQCSATTKKGTRCSRSARSNGYCWQHGG